MSRTTARRRLSLSGTALVLATIAAQASTANAQQPQRPAAPAPAPAPAPATLPDVQQAQKVDDLTAAVPGGITADQVGTRAGQTSYQAKAAQETLASASTRVDAAYVNWFPRIGLTARYTRLSDFTPSSLGDSSSGSLTGNPFPAPAAGAAPTPLPAGTPLFPVNLSFSFPLVLNNYLTQATIAVPISDYFLRISQGYAAATHAEEASRFDVVAARAKSYSDGKIAYYTWLRARGALTVAQQSREVAVAHLKDAQNQFNAGNASKADVLRAETQVAAGDLAVERAKSGVAVTERQVRIAMHAPDEENLQPGDPLDGELPAVNGNLKSLVSDAVAQRAELKSIEKSAAAARKSADVANAGKYPVVSGFGDVTYANPNPRRFPSQDEWFPTWSVGAQVTWSPNDLLAASPAQADAEARANALEAQKNVVKDGIELEVTSAYNDLLAADTSIQTTKRQLESALEAYRVAKELFNVGRATSTTLIDAENALAQTRFDHLNARVDARLARIRLDHAIGRDAKTTAP